MKNIRLLLVLSLIVAAVAHFNSYLVITPSEFRLGQEIGVSINILKSTGDVAVQVELVRRVSCISFEETISANNGTFQPGAPGLLNISVPENIRPGSFYLLVKGVGGLNFSDSTQLVYERKSVSIFIQTDKAMYKPGHTVHFRAFAMFPNMSVSNATMDVEIHDPQNNKIKLWLNRQHKSGVITDYLITDTEAQEGDWKIIVKSHGQAEEKTFTIKKYVLPRFEVTIDVPPFALTSDGNIQGSLKALYTYGKLVVGNAKLQARISTWSRPSYYYGPEPMVEISLNVNGTSKFLIPMDTFTVVGYDPIQQGSRLSVTATVTETLTNITMKEEESVYFYTQTETIDFLSSNPKTFKPGLQYTAYVKVSRHGDASLFGKREKILLETTVFNKTGYYYRNEHYNLPDKTIHVPESGIVPIHIDIPETAAKVSLLAVYKTTRTHLDVNKAESPSDSYIQLLLKSTSLKVGEKASFQLKSTQTINSMTYQIIAKGRLINAGSINGGNQSNFDFSLPVTTDMAPNARMVVYFVRDDGEIVTDSISFDIELFFPNQVSIAFDKTKAQPGDSVNVQVSADPMSVVNLLAVDQSVLLLKSGNDITESQVIDELNKYDKTQRFNSESNTQEVFKNARVNIMTDAVVIGKQPYYSVLATPYPGFFTPGPGYTYPPGRPTSASYNFLPSFNQNLPKVTKIRKNFPETWLWTNETVGPDGNVTITTVVPDTITSWVASAFAVNSVTGFGTSSVPAKIKAFKPFFVSLTLPYSMIRGEHLVLQANVFNYLTTDTDVLVTLVKNDDINNVMIAANGSTFYVSEVKTENIHIKAGEARTVYFPVVPVTIGPIPLTVKAQSAVAADAVTRQLLVEPEGVPKEYNTPILINLRNGSSVSESVNFTLPKSVVPGSERVKISVIGDILGTTVNNLDRLLKMPHGCGEQTLMKLAPDVYITKYLSATNQLTDTIKSKAINFMEKGYQRELTFQRFDGSFSVFVGSSGSFWLTANVIKIFHQAKQYIYVDDNVILRTVEWVLREEEAHNYLQGIRLQDVSQKTTDIIIRSASVIIALEEVKNMGDSSLQSRIHYASLKARGNIEALITNFTDVNVLAIASYALALSDSPRADSTFMQFNKFAIQEDDTKHWHKMETEITDEDGNILWNPPNYQPSSVDIEMASYALLVYAHKKQYSDGLPVMKWLTKQRNPYGGFVSTKDTVLALQALCEFAAGVYSKDRGVTINVQADTTTNHFTVTDANALVLQSTYLPSLPSLVTVNATGNGSAVVEVSLSMHVQEEPTLPAFNLSANVIDETADWLILQADTWSYRNVTDYDLNNMIIQEIHIPTGFEPDMTSIKVKPSYAKAELKGRKVILYYRYLYPTISQPDEWSTVQIKAFRTGLVARTQPTPVRVYFYYKPEYQATTFYQSNISQNASVCDVCPLCRGCY